MSVDFELKTILEGFGKDILGRPDPTESLSVTVQRKSRFVHEAQTASRLSVRIDEPEAFGGTGQSPDPAEYLLAALGASLSVTMTAHAAMREIPLHSVELVLSGQINARSFFEPHQVPRLAGVRGIQIELKVTSNAPRVEISKLVRDALVASPVVASLKKRPRVSLVLRR